MALPMPLFFAMSAPYPNLSTGRLKKAIKKSGMLSLHTFPHAPSAIAKARHRKASQTEPSHALPSALHVEKGKRYPLFRKTLLSCSSGRNVLRDRPQPQAISSIPQHFGKYKRFARCVVEMLALSPFFTPRRGCVTLSPRAGSAALGTQRLKGSCLYASMHPLSPALQRRAARNLRRRLLPYGDVARCGARRRALLGGTLPERRARRRRRVF